MEKNFASLLRKVVDAHRGTQDCEDEDWDKYNTKFLIAILELFKFAVEEVSEKDPEVYEKLVKKYKKYLPKK